MAIRSISARLSAERGDNRNNNSRAATLVGLTDPPRTAIVSHALGAFFEDLAVFFESWVHRREVVELFFSVHVAVCRILIFLDSERGDA